MKYRNRTEIIHDILETARNNGISGVAKTKIMYSAFLSYHQINEYLAMLIDNGLIHHDIGDQKFSITEKGLSFLQLCDQMSDLIKVEEEPQQQQRW